MSSPTHNPYGKPYVSSVCYRCEKPTVVVVGWDKPSWMGEDDGHDRWLAGYCDYHTALKKTDATVTPLVNWTFAPYEPVEDTESHFDE